MKADVAFSQVNGIVKSDGRGPTRRKRETTSQETLELILEDCGCEVMSWLEGVFPK